MPAETVDTPVVESNSLITSPEVTDTPTEFVPWKGFANDKGDLSPGWTEHLPEELGDSRKGFEKFKNITEIAKAQTELEKMLGQKAGAVKIPTKDSKPEEWSAYRKAQGIPEDPKEYKFAPTAVPENLDWNEDVAKPFAEIAHKYGIPPQAMQELADTHLKSFSAALDSTVATTIANKEAGLKDLRQTWGDDFDKNLVSVQSLAKLAGLDPLNKAFEDVAVVKAFAKLSSFMSDDTISKSGVAMTQTSAQIAKDIMTNPENPKHKLYMSGDEDVAAFVRHHLKQANPGR